MLLAASVGYSIRRISAETWKRSKWKAAAATTITIQKEEKKEFLTVQERNNKPVS